MTPEQSYKLRLGSTAIVFFIAAAILAGALGLYKRNKNLSIREKKYSPLIYEAARRHHLPPELLMAVVWKESRFRSTQVGSCGEIGLMQLMDGAIKDWSAATKRKLPSKSQLFEPQVNLEIGAWYLAQAHAHWQDYASQELLALAEYNAGYTRVNRWKPENKRQKITPADISFPSTRSYITQILEKKKYYAQHKPQ